MDLLILKYFFLSLDPQLNFLKIYTHYQSRMTQENKTMENMIKEILVNLKNIKENQKRLEEEEKKFIQK